MLLLTHNILYSSNQAVEYYSIIIMLYVQWYMQMHIYVSLVPRPFLRGRRKGPGKEFPAFTGKIEHAQTVCTRPFPPPPQERAWVRG